MTIRIAIIGVGKIARDQHVPTIFRNPAFRLVAGVDPHHVLDGVPAYPTIEALFADQGDIEAVAICTPPQARYEIARQALERGCHVLLEKPPCVTLIEAKHLTDLAQRHKVTLFTAWHSREAAGVESARNWVAQTSIRRASVTWKEDVRVWHPGQSWIWRTGGLGVFDPGINALSILTYVMPRALRVKEAQLSFPVNCETPIAASLQLLDEAEIRVDVELNFLHTGTQMWDIDIESDDGSLQLSDGGATLRINGDLVFKKSDSEYARLYTRFRHLIEQRAIDVDLSPLRLVAEAFSVGERVLTEPFIE